MRIIAGKHRGRILKEFDGCEIRPTSDRAKEALFNMFSSVIPNCTFLDLFAGSGAVGIEAVSRGAKEVVFTDIRRESVDLINKNLAMIKETATVILKNGLDYLKTCNKKFDFIFIDPPYKSDLGFSALKIISEFDLLNDGGYAVFESDKEVDLTFNNFIKVSQRRYGKNCFNIYKRV